MTLRQGSKEGTQGSGEAGREFRGRENQAISYRRKNWRLQWSMLMTMVSETSIEKLFDVQKLIGCQQDLAQIDHRLLSARQASRNLLPMSLKILHLTCQK